MYKVREEYTTCRISHKMVKRSSTNFTINNIIMDIQRNHSVRQTPSNNRRILSKILRREVRQIHTTSTTSNTTNTCVASIERT